MTDSKWIRFDEVPNEKRKTKFFVVKTKDSDIQLGAIYWFGRWRCYAFFPAPDTVFEKTCLQDITNFIKHLMDERKLTKNGTEKA